MPLVRAVEQIHKPEPQPPWRELLGRRPTVSLLLATALFILFIVGACIYANAVIWDYATTALGHPMGLGVHVSFTQTFVRYDAQHYLGIAEHGYRYLLDAAFLPLYSLLVHLLAALTHISYVWAGLSSTWLALGGAIVVVYQWLRLELNSRHITNISPWHVLGLMAIFPTSFYLALPYTEALFVLLTVGALYCYRRQQYLAATMLAVLASTTRYQGLVLGVFFLADYLFEPPSRTWRKLIPLVGSIIGFGVFILFLTVHYGSPLTFLLAEQQWHRLAGNVISGLVQSFRPLYLWFFVVIAAGLYGTWKYLGTAYTVYCLVFILLPLSSGRFDSIDRYIVSLVPLFLGLALWAAQKRSLLLTLAYTTSSAFLLAWYIMLFANGYWVA